MSVNQAEALRMSRLPWPVLVAAVAVYVVASLLAAASGTLGRPAAAAVRYKSATKLSLVNGVIKWRQLQLSSNINGFRAS